MEQLQTRAALPIPKIKKACPHSRRTVCPFPAQVCVDNGRSTKQYMEWSLLPNQCALNVSARCGGSTPGTAHAMPHDMHAFPASSPANVRELLPAPALPAVHWC